MRTAGQPGHRRTAWLLLVLVLMVPAGASCTGAGSGQGNAHVERASAMDGSSWPMPGHDAGATNFNPDERSIGAETISRLRLAWTFPYVDQAVATPTRVYAIAEGNPPQVVVLDARTGRRSRAYDPSALHLTHPPVSFSAPGDRLEVLAYAEGKLVIGTTTEVFAINPDSGRQFWRVRGGAFELTVAGGTVYAVKSGCQNPCGTMGTWAIDLRSGRVRWRHLRSADGPPVLIAGRLYQQYEYWTNDVGRSNPTHVYNPRSGRLIASWPLAFYTFWIGDRSGAYASFGVNRYPSCRQEVGRFSQSGRPLWKLNTGGECSPMGGMALASNTLYVAAQSVGPGSRQPSRIVAADTRTGRVRWRFAIGSCHVWYGACQTAGLVAANHMLFVETAPSRQIEVLDAHTGRLIRWFAIPLWSAEGYGASPSLVVAGGTLYVGGLRAYSLRGAGPGSAPTSTATSSPTPPATPYPNALSLFRKSVIAMASVHQVHSQGVWSLGDYRRQLRLSVSGDCDVTSSAGHSQRLLRATLQEHGGYYSFGKLRQRVDGSYIAIGSDKTGRAWERSATHHRWQEIRYETSSLPLGMIQTGVCPGALNWLSTVKTYRHRLKNLGPARVRGVATWHLQTTKQDPTASYTWDLYIDRRSLRQVRVTYAVVISSVGVADRHQQTDYSRFNIPLHIVPPTPGANQPGMSYVGPSQAHRGVPATP